MGSIPGQSKWYLWRTKWYWNRLFSQYFCFAMSLSFHQCPTLIFIYMRLIQEGQMGEPRETSRELCSFENRGTLNIKLLLRDRYGVRFHSSLFNLSNLGDIFKRTERGHVGHFYRASMHPSNNIWKLTEKEYMNIVLSSKVLPCSISTSGSQNRKSI
jgi:hypothetical protein